MSVFILIGFWIRSPIDRLYKKLYITTIFWIQSPIDRLYKKLYNDYFLAQASRKHIFGPKWFWKSLTFLILVPHLDHAIITPSRRKQQPIRGKLQMIRRISRSTVPHAIPMWHPILTQALVYIAQSARGLIRTSWLAVDEERDGLWLVRLLGGGVWSGDPHLDLVATREQFGTCENIMIRNLDI